MIKRIRETHANKEQGFTLIELLVVVIIIGILAAIAIPVFLNQRKKGVDAGLKVDLKNAATAAEAFITDNPTSTTAITGANLGTGGFKKTTGNTIEVKGTPAAGHCIRGLNAGSSLAASTYYYYDSRLGGLQPTASASGPTGGACATAGTFSAVP